MITITGYEVKGQLHESEHSYVFRATRADDGLAVILKILKGANPTKERIARFKREHELQKGLSTPGIVAVHDFLYLDHHWLFVEEDFGGESLAMLGLAGRIGIGEFLTLATDVAGHLAAIHLQGIIHKDITPANIILEPTSGVSKLIDFGIATRLSRETVAFDHHSLIEGTPAYLSPEQTGRINQPLDHRTDLYSLGCTLYELLTGAPPFEADDIIELIHCHLARTPEPPHVRRSEIPGAVSAIVMKLLAKNAGERYQSARGLQVDLARCRDEHEKSGTISDFNLAREDVAPRLVPTGRLYGRDAEIARLLSMFEKVARGTSGIGLVSGHSGIGKSALIKELYRPVTRSHGFFVAGKLDQFQRDRPYGPFLDALDSLVGQVLMEPPERMTWWARTIQAATDSMLPALVAVLPRLELLYDRMPPILSLPPEEARRRFSDALAAFIGAFARSEHPVVLFIDDLQWADSATLDLLQHLMTGEPIRHLLLLGAYRDHEVPAAHPLRTTIRAIGSAGAAMDEISIGPITVEDTAALLSDMLHRTPDDVREPATLIHRKTGGNPFFVQTFADTLVADGSVFFDHDAGRWRWDADRMRVLDLSDNVVDLLVANLQKLPSDTRSLLIIAACIGNHFELDLLAAVARKGADQAAHALMPALQESYLIPTTGDYRLLETDVPDLSAGLHVAYKFAHDRIQQAAYNLTRDEAHAATHLRIGRAMRAHYTGKSADTHLLDMVNQLDQAWHLIDSVDERREVAALNLKAGKKAKHAVANGAALDYFESGLRLLDGTGSADDSSSVPSHERAFRESHSLALALAEGAAEAAYLDARFDTMDGHVDAVLAFANEPTEQVKATQSRINALTGQNQLAAAISEARGILERLSVVLPEKPTEQDIDTQFAIVARELGERSPRDLADLPEMTDPIALAAIRVLNSIYITSNMAEPALAPLVAAQMVLLSIRHGLAEDSVHGFIFYGIWLCGRGDLAQGNDYGEVAEFLVERHQRKSQMPDLAVLGSFYIFHWRRPVRGFIQKMRDGYRAGLESGYIGPGSNCLQCSSAMGYLAGCDLAEIDEEYAESTIALERHQQGPYLTWLRQYHQAVRCFRGLTKEPTRLVGDIYDEVRELASHIESSDLVALFMIDFNKAILRYHFHDYHGALESARAIEKGNQAAAVLLPVIEMYQCLSLLVTASNAEPSAREALLAEASTLVDRMKRWGESCRVNYAHKYELMAAELCRVRGLVAEARDHYDRAIDLASKHEYTQEEALALERAALFYLDQKNTRLAGYYMRDSHYAYHRWGAMAKTEHQRREYGYLLEREADARSRARGGGRRTTTTTTTNGLEHLDIETVLSATRAIARETDIRRLLETVMRVSLENAGAERGFLILVRDDQLIVKVRGELGEHERFEALSLALHDQEGIAQSVVHYVARTLEPVLLSYAAEQGPFVHDPHIQKTACKSILCVPIRSQGSLVAISYLENNRATSVFNEDRLDVLTLLMGQAAISVENALLKESEDVQQFHFRVGGSLPIDSSAYVRRKADDLLAASIQGGELCYVFNTRQMGKSSLRIRTVDRLSKTGFACVSVDISSIGSRDVTLDQWYAAMARLLVTGLGLAPDFNLRRFWRDRSEFSPVHRLDVLVDEVILERVEHPIAVFIDEVDAVLSLSASLDDFFALLRLFYNRRAEDSRYERLRIVLLGVASPTDLIRDRQRTPFNIGRAIPLSGFHFDEAKSLLPGLTGAGNAEQILRSVLGWTSGQPFLTQKLCQFVVEDESRPVAGRERGWVANLVHRRVLDGWRHRDEPEHLKTIEARILHAPHDVRALLQLYRRIRSQGEVEVGQSPLETTLLLSGLATRAFDKLCVGNRIYETVFNDAWIDSCLAAIPA